MTNYQVEYKVLPHWSDWRWTLIEADSDEDAAWKAKDFTDSRGFELLDVKPITGNP
jgi:hypothetical protein